MTSLAAPVRREFGTVAACAIALVPVLVFAVGWAAIQVAVSPVPVLILVGVLILPGWVAWVALQARSDFVVVVWAVLASTALPASQFVISDGSRLERMFYIGLIGLAILIGIVVAMRIMRKGGWARVVSGAALGVGAMVLVLLPLLFRMFVITR